jgi:LysR family transcriptional activator of nhaA
MIPLNYHHLYYFYTVAKAGSIAAAMDELMLAQPTISAQIKALERFFKRPLFERRQRRLRLTEDGRLVMDYAESIFGLGRELEDALRDRRPNGGSAVQLGIVVGTPRAWSHALAEATLAQFPSVHLVLKEGTPAALADDLRDRRLDLVISEERVQDPTDAFLVRQGGRVPVVFAAARDTARRIRRWPQDLDRTPVLLPLGPLRTEAFSLFTRWRVSPRIVAEIDDVEVSRRLVQSGRGVGMLNAATAAVGGLVTLGPAGDLHQTLHLTLGRRRRVNPVAQSLFDKFSLPTVARTSAASPTSRKTQRQ